MSAKQPTPPPPGEQADRMVPVPVPLSVGLFVEIKLEVTTIGPEGTQTTTIKTHAIVRQIEFVKYHIQNQTNSHYAIPSLTLENHGHVDVKSVGTRRRNRTSETPNQKPRQQPTRTTTTTPSGRRRMRR